MNVLEHESRLATGVSPVAKYNGVAGSYTFLLLINEF